MSLSKGKKSRRRLTRMLEIFLFCSVGFLCGCMGGKREVSVVFLGDDVIARVATNEKIPLVVKTPDGRTLATKRDVGQAVVIPLRRYRELLKLAKGGRTGE